MDSMQRLLKGVGGENDNLTRIDREIPKLKLYYIILWAVWARHTLHSH
jgi:hypothetical protein